MNPSEAAERARQQQDLKAFVSLCDDAPDAEFTVAVKDVIDVAGLPTTSGTSAVPAYTPDSDAPVTTAIRSAGGGIVGKTNLHEWAIGLTSNNPSFGRVVNPRYRELIAGGSSGGSAAAVAAGLCDWALGTDTGGSIRVPAAACGVVGLKPTLGLLSNEGVVPVSESLDTVGPMAQDVATIESAMAVLTGMPVPSDLEPSALVRPPASWLGELDPAVQKVWNEVSDGLAVADLPDRDPITAAAWSVLAFEAHRFHRQRLAMDPAPFSPDVRDVLDRGAVVSQEEYEASRQVLADAARRCDAALGEDTVLIIPATASAIPTHTDGGSREPLTRFTRPFNGTGQPTICLPAPSDEPPIGIQLVARRGADWRLLRTARVLERKWAQIDRSSEG